MTTDPQPTRQLCTSPSCNSTAAPGSVRCAEHTARGTAARPVDPATFVAETTWSGYLYVLSLLTGLGALIFGAVLALQTDQICDPASCASQHTHIGAGIAIMVAGVLQALFIASFGALHLEVRALRIEVARQSGSAK